MLQLILVYLIVAAAVICTAISVVKSLRKKSKSSVCEGCDGCGMKKEITKNLKEKGLNTCDQYHTK